MISKYDDQFSYYEMKRRYGPCWDSWRDFCIQIPKEKQLFALLDFIHHAVLIDGSRFENLHSDYSFYNIAREIFNRTNS